MKKDGFREKLRYAFDNYMGKGTLALIGMLFLITAIVVIIAGILGSAGQTDTSVGNNIWMSLMHALDAGTLAGDDTSRIGFVILMSVVTICGIFVTSILIGIISTGFEEKLNSLRKGFSRVVENRHTVIIGFNDGIYTVLKEIIEANSNEKNGRILVVGTEDKEVMDEEIRNHIDDFKTTKVICRSGDPTHSAVLAMSAVENARSIVINEEDDFMIIKIILSVVAYLKEKQAFENDAHITATIHDKKYLQAALIAAEGKAEIIYFKEVIARVIANTCRQPGLSNVLTGVFSFEGDEFYFERFPELTGKKFGDVLNLFKKSTVVGICKAAAGGSAAGENAAAGSAGFGTPLLNPPMDTVIEEGDAIIHLSEDNGVSFPAASLPTVNIRDKVSNMQIPEETENNLLILGHNESLPLILRELDDFLPKGSKVVIACYSLPEEAETEWKHFENLEVMLKEADIYDRPVLEELLTPNVRNILLLSDRSDDEDADSRSLILLLQLREISNVRHADFNITSEMNSAENQRLLRVTKVNDFIVGSSITNLIMSQISENRHLKEFLTMLLVEEGSEFYMKPSLKYVRPDAEVSFYEMTEIVKNHNEIFMGYKKNENGEMKIVVNPDKAGTMRFRPEDKIIVIAEDGR